MNMSKTSYTLVDTEVMEFWNCQAHKQREAFEAIACYMG